MEQVFELQGPQNFDEYIMIAPGSDYGMAMWRDIGKVENAALLESPVRTTNKLLEILHHAHFSFAINKKVQLPFQKIWKPYYALESIQLVPEKRYCIIFTDISACRTDVAYLKELQGKSNLTLVMIMVNTVVKKKKLLEKRMSYFEKIFTFDRNDAAKYQLIYHPANYSMTDLPAHHDPEHDAFYVGVAKDRLTMLTNVYRRIMEHGAKALFYISGVKKQEMSETGIHYNKWITYKTVLEYIRNSNCIVEILDSEQEGMTLRNMEAICYNKKLLTNNSSVKQSPYYKTGFIQFFSSPDEIDVDFIRRREPVDYGYNGEFSPVHFLEHINREVAKKHEITDSLDHSSRI